MQLEHLEYLLDFAETGTVSEAAARNYITEQGMSRIFRRLEKESKVVLFRKEGKSLRFTEAGEEFAKKAEQVVADYRQIRDICDYYAGTENIDEDEFYVYTTSCTALCVLPFLDLQMPGLFPFPVSLREVDLPFFADSSAFGKHPNSIAIVSVPSYDWTYDVMERIQENGLQYIPLLRSGTIALVSASSPLAQLDTMPHDKYESKGVRSTAVACLRDVAALDQVGMAVREDNLRTVTSNIQVIKTQIRRGQVSLFLPKLVLATMPTGRGIIALPLDSLPGEEDVAIDFGLLVSEEHYENERVQRVITYIKTFLISYTSKPSFEGIAMRLF